MEAQPPAPPRKCAPLEPIQPVSEAAADALQGSSLRTCDDGDGRQSKGVVNLLARALDFDVSRRIFFDGIQKNA